MIMNSISCFQSTGFAMRITFQLYWILGAVKPKKSHRIGNQYHREKEQLRYYVVALMP